MYMSRIALNLRRRGAQKLIFNRNAMHAAVASSFPPGSTVDGEGARVLWRLDSDGDERQLIIVSPREPCLVHIGEQAGWSTGTPWATRSYLPFLSSITANTPYQFRLAANPTHRLADPGAAAPGADGGADPVKRRSKVVAHVSPHHQLNWLVAKAEAHGFHLESEDAITLSNRERPQFRRGATTVSLSTVQFDGRLVVDDADLFRAALIQGIGRAKGYGFGLLTVLPATR